MIKTLRLVILALAMSAPALAKDAPHPAFGDKQTSILTVEAQVPDIPKLEAKAIDILRTKYGLTLAEAREKVRIDGKTDVARCMEYVVINALAGITQANVVGTRIEQEHPEPQP